MKPRRDNGRDDGYSLKAECTWPSRAPEVHAKVLYIGAKCLLSPGPYAIEYSAPESKAWSDVAKGVRRPKGWPDAIVL